MAAVAGAVLLASTAVMSSPPVQHAAAEVAPAVVHEIKSLEVRLTASDPVYPFYYAPRALGTAITVPLWLATEVVAAVADGASQVLTNLHVDARIAQQPTLIMHNLAIPIAVGAQGAFVSAVDVTYTLGHFTPAQAWNFFVNAVKDAVNGFVAAERQLFGLAPATATKPVTTAAVQTPAIASTTITGQKSTVTLSTLQADAPATVPHDKKATVDPGPTQTSAATADDTATAKAAAAKKTPTFKLPTFKLPTLKLVKPKSNSSADSSSTAGSVAAAPVKDSGATAAAPKVKTAKSTADSGSSK
ncbi:hypothetical protein [Mycolicibacterium sp. J2]|uniref:hypothetical protein n=1 Tax=Mycolicibacterium sp. J2 TaxID=2993511 RepID=UPI00224AE167|nr:hypothetical protein [Mycolicibacterium sp. J2]MCX2715709.1 hypothetical protein [Mycolicibacterium sp. J2]